MASSRRSPRRPGERAGLTTDRVTQAARELLRREGPSGLSMRKVASELGVLPNALYGHVADRQALADALVDSLLGDVPTTEGKGWRRDVQALLGGTRAAMLAEPALAELYVARAGRGPNALRLAGWAMQLLRDGGLSDAEAIEAFRVLLAYTVGFVAFETGRRTDRARTDPEYTGLVREAIGVEGLAEPAGNHEFNLGLSWLLDGAEARARARR